MHADGADPSAAGRVEAIHVAPEAGAPMVPLARARAIAASGLEGDRYATGRGHWSPPASSRPPGTC